MSSKMLSMIFVSIFLASIFFNVANGWCIYPLCQCASFYYEDCPGDCHIDSCSSPPYLDCAYYPDERLPSVCIQPNHHHHHDHEPAYIPAPAPYYPDTDYVQPHHHHDDIHLRFGSATNIKVEWMILLTPILAWIFMI